MNCFLPTAPTPISGSIKIDQLDVTCFIISLFTAQHVSNASTSIFRSLGLTVDLFHVLYCSGSMCVGVTVWFGWGGVVSLCRLKQSFNLHKDTTWFNYSTIKMMHGPINLRPISGFCVSQSDPVTLTCTFHATYCCQYIPGVETRSSH